MLQEHASADQGSNYDQGRYWILTIPCQDNLWNPNLWGLRCTIESDVPSSIQWLIGQREIGEGGYEHWQVFVSFKKKVRRRGVKSLFGRTTHCELSRSSAAEQYVLKEDSRIEGTQFKFGSRAVVRSRVTDWDQVREQALAGDWTAIPSDIFIRCYSNLRRINSHFALPIGMEREVWVFVGPTGTGKSHRAWTEAGLSAYPKGPTSKFWDGYDHQEHVLLTNLGCC